MITVLLTALSLLSLDSRLTAGDSAACNTAVAAGAVVVAAASVAAARGGGDPQ